MRVRRRLALVVLLLCAAVGTPALAAGADEADEAVVVARHGDVTLFAGDNAGTLCITMPERGQEEATACGPAEIALMAIREGRSVRFAGVAVPVPAASIEIRRAGRVLGSAAAVVGGAYKGEAAGAVRFAVVRLPPGTPDDGLRIHARDGAGALLAVFTAPIGEELVFGRRRLLSGRRGGVNWHVTEELSFHLEPSVLDPAREAVWRCIYWAVGGGADVNCTAGSAREGIVHGDPARFLTQQDGCRPDFRLLHGVVDAAVGRVTVLLGDGRRRTARMAALRDGDRVFALPVSSADAVRGATLHRAGGADTFRELALAPLAVLCAPPDADSPISTGLGTSLRGSLDDPPTVTPAGPVTTLPGPPVVRVADGPAETLCLAIGDRPFTPLGCAVVAPLPSDLLGASHDVGVLRTFALAVPAKVATVRFRASDGAVVLTIPTIAGAGYAGRYAGAVRFVSAAVPDFRRLATIELLDAGGRVLYRDTEMNTRRPEMRIDSPRRVAGRAGGPSLWQTTLRYGDERRTRCLALTAGPRPPIDEACDVNRQTEAVLLGASCATRRLTVAVAARPATLVLADTFAPTPRRIRLRAGAGLLTLRPGTRLRALTFIRGRSRREMRLNAPPATRQCGWRLAFELPRPEEHDR